MAVKKSELYSTLWKCCDELRGGMDASQYKDYVLVILFVKYISDKKRNDEGFDIDIPKGCYFEDFVALKGNPNIGEEMNKKMAALAEENQLGGVFVADFEDDTKLGKGKDKVETLSKLIAVFQNENLDFSKNRAADDDLIGDAYEYLMKNFATESGKSKGQFYTPAEVSRVMAEVIGLGNAKNGKKTTIYDPTCGSGSLLLRAMCETPGGATLYGQEKDNATVGLAKMNMILHNEIYADIRQGDTINDPQFKESDQLKTFDYIVANPPFSTKSWLKSAKFEDEYHRWGEGIKIGVPPEKNGDYAFLLHIVRSLKQTGCAACILPHGVLFRGNAEAQIRKYLVAEKRYIKGIIGLPANLFYGTGIPACIIIIEKSEAVGRKGVFMIDAKGGYIKDGAKNRLREQDIRRIVDAWQAQRDVPHYARFVPMEEIERNDYNLNIPRYVDSSEAAEHWDVYASMFGGIPTAEIDEMSEFWTAFPALKKALFTESGIPYVNVSTPDIKSAIKSHPDVVGFENAFNAAFSTFPAFLKEELIVRMGSIEISKAETVLSADIFERLKEIPLIDKYAAFQLLDDDWTGISIDLEMLQTEGFAATKKVDPNLVIKKKDGKDQEVQEGWVGHIIPFDLVQATLLSTKTDELHGLESRLAEIPSEYESILDEMTEEDKESCNDVLTEEGDAFVPKEVSKKIKDLKKDRSPESVALRTLLEKVESLIKSEKEIKAEIKAKSAALQAKTKDTIESLSDEQALDLLEKKWIAPLIESIHKLPDTVIDSLVSKIQALQNKYATTFFEVEQQISETEATLSGMIDDLEGNEYDMLGLNELKKLLGGSAE